MRCVSCDTELEPTSQFCDACGTRQVVTTSTPLAAPSAPPSVRPSIRDAPRVRPEHVVAAMRDVAVLETAEPNAVYLGQRLHYADGAETFDVGHALGLRTFAQLKSLFLVATVIFVAYLAIVFLIGGGVVKLLGVAVAMFNIALLVTPFVRDQGFVISEWKLLLDGKGHVADAVYDHIALALVERDTPVEYRAIRIPEIWWRGYLQIRMLRYSGFVTCFRFGEDLYIGWTLWWWGSWLAYRKDNRQGGLLELLKAPWVLVMDMLNGRASTYELAYIHQYDEAKALRECLHAVTRQGVEAAIGVVPMRGSGTIGSTVPEGEAPRFAESPSFGDTVGRRRR